MPFHPNRALRFISCCRPQVERSCSDVVGTCRSLESPECEPRPTLGVVDLRACYRGVKLGLRLFIGTLSITLILAALPIAAWSQAPVQAAPKSLRYCA
jgi:hypothetical protein